MKKYIFPVITSLMIGSVLSFIFISSYDGSKSIAMAKNVETVYYIQRGVYSSKESMEDNMRQFEHYIYNVDNNMYYTYIGVSKNIDNAKKISKYYQKQDFDTFIKEKTTDNKNFLVALGQYDQILEKTSDDKIIKTICNQVLSQYEELINNEN